MEFQRHHCPWRLHNAPPLRYTIYLLSKAYYNIFRVNGDKPYKQVLIDYRIFSKICVVLLVLVLLIVYRNYLKMNWIWLPIVISAFFNHLGTEDGHILWGATETGLYGFWTLLIGLNLLLLHVIEGKWEATDRRASQYFLLYGLIPFALISTVAPGIIQVGVPFILIFSLWRYSRTKAFFERPEFSSLYLSCRVLWQCSTIIYSSSARFRDLMATLGVPSCSISQDTGPRSCLRP